VRHGDAARTLSELERLPRHAQGAATDLVREHGRRHVLPRCGAGCGHGAAGGGRARLAGDRGRAFQRAHLPLLRSGRARARCRGPGLGSVGRHRHRDHRRGRRRQPAHRRSIQRHRRDLLRRRRHRRDGARPTRAHRGRRRRRPGHARYDAARARAPSEPSTWASLGVGLALPGAGLAGRLYERPRPSAPA
jgi:hypothetical protein